MTSKITPQECVFDINSEMNDGVLRIELVVFPKDNNHPLCDNLSEENLSILPDYLAKESMHAENTWDWDGDAPKTLEEMQSDMEAFGYTHERGLTFF